MKIGFIGAGTVARSFGRHLITAGHTIVVSNSRGPETLTDFVADLGPDAIAGTKQQAAECEVVILATNRVKPPSSLALQPRLFAVVEDDSHGVPMAGTQTAYAMTQIHSVCALGALYGAMTDREGHSITLLKAYDFGPGLHAGTLFG